MEESKTFVAQPASYQAQRLRNTGVTSDSRAAPPNARVVSSEKAGHIPVSTGTLQSTPAVHVSSVASTTSAFRPPGTEVPAAVVSSSMAANIPKESTPVVPPRVDRAHLRSDGRLNGALVPHIPGLFIFYICKWNLLNPNSAFLYFLNVMVTAVRVGDNSSS